MLGRVGSGEGLAEEGGEVIPGEWIPVCRASEPACLDPCVEWMGGVVGSMSVAQGEGVP